MFSVLSNQKNQKEKQSFLRGQSVQATVSCKVMQHKRKKMWEFLIRNDKPENKPKSRMVLQHSYLTDTRHFSCQHGCLITQIMYHKIKNKKSFINITQSSPFQNQNQKWPIFLMPKQFLFKELSNILMHEHKLVQGLSEKLF